VALDYRNPDYTSIIAERANNLNRLRATPGAFPALAAHYRNAPAEFISDWGVTFEPRNLERGLISTIPFVLWPKQTEYIHWLLARWQSGERGLCDKSRDCGVTWLSVGFAISMWLFVPGFTVGFGSRKEELVDKRGDPKSIFEKLRFFLAQLPHEFLPRGYSERTCSAHMRLINPVGGGTITGEAGDEIGRGGRTSIYLVDEAAFIERQDTVDAALSQTTNCQIDISTPNGSGNAFYKKRMRFANTLRVFTFSWRDDPRKDDAWYQRQREEQSDLTVAQEIDLDYNASSEDSFIPAKWVVASIDAHKSLGIAPSGVRATGFDPADVGDAKAVVNRHGSVILGAEIKSEGDAGDATQWAFRVADEFRADVLIYDGDGMGAPVMKTVLKSLNPGRIDITAYHGSSGVIDPGRHAKGQAGEKSNSDTYQNYRAQTWSWARARFAATYKAVERARAGFPALANIEELIAIDGKCTRLQELQAELSRPMRKFSANGKIQVEAKADMRRRGVSSPNLADALIMALSVTAVRDDGLERQEIALNEFDPIAVGYDLQRPSFGRINATERRQEYGH
jgi:hypothetical protein